MNKVFLLTSKEAKAALKVQDCDLAHIRNAGKLKYTKKGNAFLYYKDSIEQYIIENKMQGNTFIIQNLMNYNKSKQQTKQTKQTKK